MGTPGTTSAPIKWPSLDSAATVGITMSTLVSRWAFGSASVAQAAVPYCSLKDQSLTETQISARMVDAIAYPLSVAKTCGIAHLETGIKRERRSWSSLCPIEGIANAILRMCPVSQIR